MIDREKFLSLHVGNCLFMLRALEVNDAEVCGFKNVNTQKNAYKSTCAEQN